MHGTQRPLTVWDFARFKNTLRQSRETRKRYEQLYLQILNIVEDKIGREMLVNKLAIADALRVDATQVGYIIDDHPKLGRIVRNHQRTHGWRQDQRIQMAGEIVARNRPEVAL